METINCAVCKTPFTVPDEIMALRRQDGDTLYCPNGHKLAFRDSENKRLKNEIVRLERENRRLSVLMADLRVEPDRLYPILADKDRSIALLRRQKGYYQGRYKMLKAQLAGDEEE